MARYSLKWKRAARTPLVRAAALWTVGMAAEGMRPDGRFSWGEEALARRLDAEVAAGTYRPQMKVTKRKRKKAP